MVKKKTKINNKKINNKKITKIIRSEPPRYLETETSYGIIFSVLFLSFMMIIIVLSFLQ